MVMISGKRRKILTAFFLLLFVFSCSESSNGKKKTLSYFIMYKTSMKTYYDTLEKEYEKLNPGIDIKIERFGGSDLKPYETKVMLRFRAHKPPVLLNVHAAYIPRYIKYGLLEPAPEYIVRFIEENSLNEGVRKAGLYQGKYYGVAQDAAWQCLYYNKDMFKEAGLDPEKPPKTWDEYIEYGKKLTKYDENGRITRVGISHRKTYLPYAIADKWATFLYCAGGKLYNEELTQTLINSPEGIEALELYTNMLFKWRIDGFDVQGDTEGFLNGTVAMFNRGAWLAADLLETRPNLNFGVAHIPAKKISATQGGFYITIVPKETKYRDEAWKFIHFMMSDEWYDKYLKAANFLPLTKSLADRPEYKDNSYFKPFLTQPNVIADPLLIENEEMMGILGQYIEKTCRGHLSPKEALDKAAQEINEILAQIPEERKPYYKDNEK